LEAGKEMADFGDSGRRFIARAASVWAEPGEEYTGSLGMCCSINIHEDLEFFDSRLRASIFVAKLQKTLL
jgi:hypothetical protein